MWRGDYELYHNSNHSSSIVVSFPLSVAIELIQFQQLQISGAFSVQILSYPGWRTCVLEVESDFLT